MKKIKLLIADDHQIIIDGIKSLLDDVTEIDFIFEANNGNDAVNKALNLDIDVVLMDIDMPVLNGIEATKQIKSANKNIKIIILSMHDEKTLIQKLIKNGIDGYLIKNSDRDVLIDAVKKVAKGQKYFSSEVTMSLIDNTYEMNSNSSSNLISELTDREIEVLKLVAEGFTNKEIGEKLFISYRTVDTHRTNLMKKIDVTNIVGLIKFAINNGFVN